MTKVVMLDAGMRRNQTYEEVLDYIQTDPDKN